MNQDRTPEIFVVYIGIQETSAHGDLVPEISAHRDMGRDLQSMGRGLQSMGRDLQLNKLNKTNKMYVFWHKTLTYYIKLCILVIIAICVADPIVHDFNIHSHTDHVPRMHTSVLRQFAAVECTAKILL